MREHERLGERVEIGIGEGGLAVGIEKQFFLRGDLDQVRLGFPQLLLELRQAPFEVLARVGGRVEVVLEICRYERFSEGIGDLGRQGWVGTVEIDRYQACIAHRLDRKMFLHELVERSRLRVGMAGGVGRPAAWHDQRGDLRQRRSLVEVLIVHVIGKVQLRGNTPGQRQALQQLVLRLVVGRIVVGDIAVVVAHALDLHHLDGIAIDLHGGARTVDRRHQQGSKQHGEKNDAERGQHRPLALDQDREVMPEVDLVLAVLQILVFAFERQQPIWTSGRVRQRVVVGLRGQSLLLGSAADVFVILHGDPMCRA